MISDVREKGGGEKIQDGELSLPLGLLLSMRKQASVLTVNALPKKKKKNPQEFWIQRTPVDCVTHVTYSSSWHLECFVIHARVPLWHGGGGHPKPHRALLLSTATCCRDDHPVWSLKRSEAWSPGRSAGGDGCPSAGSLQVCAAPGMPAEVHRCLWDVLSGCCSTARISRSEQVANSGNPAPGAAFGQETLGAVAGLTACDWLGSFLCLWSKGLSLLHPHSFLEHRPCFKPGLPFAAVLLLWAWLWGTS